MKRLLGHRMTRLVVAAAIGAALSLFAFERISDPQPARQRAAEEAAVLAARALLSDVVGAHRTLEIVDPLAPKRAIGKAYVYPDGDGFEVSGHYRRNDADTWHPFLMKLDGNLALLELSLRDGDAGLRRRAAEDPRLRVVPGPA